MLKSLRIINRFSPIKFIIVGGLSTSVHALVYLFVLHWLLLHPQIANLCGFLTALFVSYIGQRSWTFSSVKIRHEHSAKIKFILSSLFSYLLNSFWVWLNSYVFVLPADFSLIGIMLITPFVTYYLLTSWVFKNE